MGSKRQFGSCSRLTAALFVAVVLLSCSGRQAVGQEEGDTLSLRHSRLLTIVDYGDYRKVDIGDPWNYGKTLHSYVLIKDSTVGILPEGTVIRVPVSRAISFTTVHAALMAELGKTDCLVGIGEGNYLKTPALRSLYEEHAIEELGSALSPDVELIVDKSPDIVLVSPFENSGGYGKLEGTGIPIVECADYMEVSPLARAEWMRFYGMLFGEERLADSLFTNVEKRYEELCDSARKFDSQPLVMVDKPMSSGVWYMPGGGSTLGRLIADANARYVLANEGKSGSIPLSIESAVDICSDADVWIFRYAGPEVSYGSLRAELKAYSLLKAFKERRVYGCSTERTLFYEQTPFHPDMLLEEIIGIFHPEGREGTYRYFKPVR